MSDQSLLHVEWFYNDSNPEKPLYSLVCYDDTPLAADLYVEIAADAVTERAARAKLIELMFNKARELKIDTSRLRFKV